MPQTSEDRAELLGRVPAFAELGADDLGRVAQVEVRRAFEPQQVIFREGDDSDTCYIVRSGHARATRQHADGRTITLATFGPGDIFGELAMFDDERRSATVQAIDDLETVAIPGSAMRGLLGRHPEIAVKLVIALGRRLRAANERLSPPVLPDRAEPRRRRARPAGRAGPRRGRGGPARRTGHG